MNSKMYMPVACLLFCAAYIAVVDTVPAIKYFMAFAGLFFAILTYLYWRKG